MLSSRTMRPRRLATILTTVALLPTSCRPTYQNLPTPITAINDSGGHRPAVIVFRDPQVFSRESLLNHRLAELDYLKRQLEQSVSQPFQAQLNRDVSALSVLSG